MSSATVGSTGHGPVSGTIRVEYHRTDITPSLAVVEAIADLAGVEPTALADEAGIVLYDHVDPDALDALVTGSRDVDVSFTVAGYDVTVDDTDVVVSQSTE